MSELKSLSPEILLHIGKLLHVPMKGLIATIKLLDEGGTVPFVARYRKEATGKSARLKKSFSTSVNCRTARRPSSPPSRNRGN
jgi:hypothetical protein